VRFAVRDAGPGMSVEELKHVFERYWQGAKDARGTGLGLCIAKGLIEAHGGRIWIESRIGAGTTLFFTLPIVERRALRA
jgi:signal transduction histidine kinase